MNRASVGWMALPLPRKAKPSVFPPAEVPMGMSSKTRLFLPEYCLSAITRQM